MTGALVGGRKRADRGYEASGEASYPLVAFESGGVQVAPKLYLGRSSCGDAECATNRRRRSLPALVLALCPIERHPTRVRLEPGGSPQQLRSARFSRMSGLLCCTYARRSYLTNNTSNPCCSDGRGFRSLPARNGSNLQFVSCAVCIRVTEDLKCDSLCW